MALGNIYIFLNTDSFKHQEEWGVADSGAADTSPPIARWLNPLYYVSDRLAEPAICLPLTAPVAVKRVKLAPDGAEAGNWTLQELEGWGRLEATANSAWQICTSGLPKFWGFKSSVF